MILGILFVIVSNIFGVLSPRVIRYVFDLVNEKIAHAPFHENAFLQTGFFHWIMGGKHIYDISFGELMVLCGITLLLLALLRGIFMYFMRQTLIVMSRYIEYDLKNEVYAHYQQLDLNFFKLHNTGDMMSRITEDVSRVRMYVGPAVMYSVNLFVLIVLTVYMMLQVNVQLTLYTLAPLPVLAGTIYYVNRLIHRKSEKIQAQLSAITTIAQEAYSGIRVIKSYVQEKATAGFFEKASRAYKTSSVNLAMTEAFYFPAMSLMIGLSTLITIYIGGVQAIQGKITAGNIAEFVVYINMLTFPVSSIGWVASMIQRAAASQKRLNEFLHTSPAIVSPPSAKRVTISGHIDFKNISFTYPHTGVQALKHFNLQIHAGQKVALIGRTGAGKSTVAQLLIRMYDPQQGSITVDGVDIRQISLPSLREQISFVPQDVFLFSDSISNNIRFGVPAATEEAVQQAARQALVEKDILGFKEGFQTVIGERGVTLSGGQKQRISIARALLKPTNLLVFDDCLSAVDAKTEKEIIANLYAYLQGKTALIITHRIFALFEFDKIVVMENGAIVEEGTHEQLMALNGYYAERYAQQQSQNREKDENEMADRGEIG